MTLTKHISYLKDDLYMAIVLLDVFKALEVKSQDCWKLLNSHPLVSLLETTPLHKNIMDQDRSDHSDYHPVVQHR